jgi:hypothetical protein
MVIIGILNETKLENNNKPSSVHLVKSQPIKISNLKPLIPPILLIIILK